MIHLYQEVLFVLICFHKLFINRSREQENPQHWFYCLIFHTYLNVVYKYENNKSQLNKLNLNLNLINVENTNINDLLNQ
jgi:hypothetical protein